MQLSRALGLAAALRRKALRRERTTVRTEGTVRPVERFEVLAGRVFVLIDGAEDVHGGSLCL